MPTKIKGQKWFIDGKTGVVNSLQRLLALGISVYSQILVQLK